MILSLGKLDSKSDAFAFALATGMSSSESPCERNLHNWLFRVQSQSKLRALDVPHAFKSSLWASTSGPPLDSFRHTSCSNSTQQDPIESKTIATKSLGFVCDEPGALFIEAISLQIFARHWPVLEFSKVDGFEGIVRQPCRRDSQCVPT